MKIVWLLMSVLLGVMGQLLMKWGLEHPKPLWSRGLAFMTMLNSWPVLAGLCAYALSSIFWLLTLKRMEISVAYPMVSLGYIFVALASYYLFNEVISVTKWTGLALILTGVFFISRS